MDAWLTSSGKFYHSFPALFSLKFTLSSELIYKSFLILLLISLLLFSPLGGIISLL